MVNFDGNYVLNFRTLFDLLLYLLALYHCQLKYCLLMFLAYFISLTNFLTVFYFINSSFRKVYKGFFSRY